MLFHCPDLAATERLARRLAPLLASGDVLLLHGDLGAGKTTFTQYLAQALGVGADQYVSSPSFALLHEYSGRLAVFHMDLYRLADGEDVEAAGLAEYFDREGLVIVEWPERLDSLVPAERLEIAIHILENQRRQMLLHPVGEAWRQKMACFSQKLASNAAKQKQKP